MKRVLIKNLDGVLTNLAEMEDPTDWIAEGKAANWWGLSERPELDEEGRETGVILPATYTLEVIDLDQDAAWLLAQCHLKRMAEYPPMADYLDGIVKNDQAQIDKYIADCKAVKDKYPKP